MDVGKLVAVDAADLTPGKTGNWYGNRKIFPGVSTGPEMSSDGERAAATGETNIIRSSSVGE
ncbi:MAG TPA: hypothetical protein VII33_07400, partial [Nakamurella sp.]